ncbi:NAD-dependent epimerase/dehydratase family protein [Agarivorans gilvus]|uniref:NAD-dependent dehydratase n=1 Tax=Agarivorans gilvus TaxID=680279 RepID=A0ABQ1HUK1_9ALTE|nr:NAD-dependent epimerase/dehydratase family protein [Agarivorans gilvus]GGA91829.1 NAD-dependent dehydratase [Agarivorans gilvus]
MTSQLHVLVTGANGHLGNNLLRELLKHGHFKVKGSVRNINDKRPFIGLDCNIVYADMFDRQSLASAFRDVDILFHVAAVFSHWSRHPKRDILQANLTQTKNVFELAKEYGVDKVVYVSSIAALDANQAVMDESTWGSHFPNMYFKSKNAAEQLAWRLAEQLNIDMVSVLPSAMIGGHVYRQLTPTMNLIDKILSNSLPFDPQYHINFVDVEDVAKGMILAAEKGRVGHRYILGTEQSMSTTELFHLAHQINPLIKIPNKLGKSLQLLLATLFESWAFISGQPPLLMRGNVRHYFKKDELLCIDKAKTELGYRPRPAEQVVKALMSESKQSRLREPSASSS